MSFPPDKPFFKIGEVCERTGTQPYVLRFWESEFPSLAPRKNRSGQRLYRQRDIELIEKIKKLLYDQEYTIAGARKVLETELGPLDGSETDPLEGADEAEAGETRHGAGKGGHPAQRGLDLGAGEGNGRHASGARSDTEPAPFSASDHAEAQLEVEVKNLRAKLAHVEGELRSLLDEMDRRDRR